MNIDREALKENLIKVSERPALYIGESRLDYLERFYYGWGHLDTEKIYPWNADFDIQRWLFINESASIAHAATINGWLLLKRCYGNRQYALNQFRRLLDEIPFSACDEYELKDTVACQIYQIYAHYHWNSGNYPVDAGIKGIIGKEEKDYESIIPLVSRMISEKYNKLWVYLHYEHYFLQVRFLYFSEESGWVDNAELIYKANYYYDLLILHGYASIIQNERHKNHIITIYSEKGKINMAEKETDDDWHSIFNADADISTCDKSPFIKTYTEWKSSIINR